MTVSRLGDHLRPLRRHWLSVLLCLILGIGGALAYLHWAPKQYEATTAVLVTSMGDAPTTDRATTINLETEAQLVTATTTVQAAADKLHQSGDAATLADNVSVTVPANTAILQITYAAPTAREAQQGSLAFADAYLEQRGSNATTGLDAQEKALQAQIDPLNAQLQKVLQAAAALPANSPDRDRVNQQVTVLNNQLVDLANQQNQLRSTVVNAGRIVTQPALPTSPSSPKTALVLAAGVILGLLAGAGVSLLRSRTDDVVRFPEDVYRRTGVAVATVLSGRLHEGEVAIRPATSSDGRGYARLRNLVTTNLAESGRPVVLVAGVRHGGGSVAANLAASLARSGEQTYLVCADVFGTTSTALLGGRPHDGLAEVLAGRTDLEQALQQVPSTPGLRVLGPGRDPDQADALLQTRSPRKLIDELLRSEAYVVIEAPATSHSPDAQTLAGMAELAVVVVEVGETGAQEVLDACAQFESVGTPVLGAVVAHYGKGKPAAPVDDTVVDEIESAPAPADRVRPASPRTALDLDVAEDDMVRQAPTTQK